MGIRTFLALDLDEPIRLRISKVAGCIGEGNAKVRWVDLKNLHVTLKFLGNVADEALADVCNAVNEVAAGAEPFGFKLRGVQAVPPVGRLRMFWVGAIDDSGLMGELYGQLEQVLAALGFPKDNRLFRPHVTLARVKYASDPAALRVAAKRFANEDFGNQWASEVTVYSSELTPRGPIYTPLSRASLGG